MNTIRRCLVALLALTGLSACVVVQPRAYVEPAVVVRPYAVPGHPHYVPPPPPRHYVPAPRPHNPHYPPYPRRWHDEGRW